MSAELQPAVELAVMRKQDFRTIGVHNPGRSGDMPHGQVSLEAIRLRPDEGEKIPDGRRLPGMPGGRLLELVDERLAVHGAGCWPRISGTQGRGLGNSLERPYLMMRSR